MIDHDLNTFICNCLKAASVRDITDKFSAEVLYELPKGFDAYVYAEDLEVGGKIYDGFCIGLLNHELVFILQYSGALTIYAS